MFCEQKAEINTTPWLAFEFTHVHMVKNGIQKLTGDGEKGPCEWSRVEMADGRRRRGMINNWRCQCDIRIPATGSRNTRGCSGQLDPFEKNSR